MWPNPQFPADLVTFTEEILNEKLHFLSSVKSLQYIPKESVGKIGCLMPDVFFPKLKGKTY